MKKKYSDVFIELTNNYKKQIEKYANLMGEPKLIEILYSNFGLSYKSSRKLIDLMSEMIPGVPHDLIPHPSMFKIKRSLKGAKSDIEYAGRLRIDYNELHSLIKKTRKAEPNVFALLQQFWDRKFWDELIEKETLHKRTRYVYSSSTLAMRILAHKYEMKINTVNKYLYR